MTGQEMLLQDALATAIETEKENIELRQENQRLRRGYFIPCYVVCAILALQVVILLARC